MLAGIGFAGLLAIAAVLLLHETRGTTLWVDEWVWALDRRGSSVGTFLEPHNGHFSLVPIVLYKALFATAGLDHYVAYRVMAVVAHLLCVALVFVYASRRVSGLAALAAATLILTLGPAWQNFLWPFQVGWLLSLAAGLGALLMLDRGDRRGDVGAFALLALALASSGLGLVIAAGLLVEVLWGRGEWRAAWIAAGPLAVYAVWWSVYQDTAVLRHNIPLAPGFAADAAGGALAALAGLTEVRVDAGGTLTDAGAALGWGRPLAIAGAGLMIWRLAKMRPVPARVLTLLTIPVSFWLLTGLQRAHVGSPDTSRYLYVGAFFVVLLVVELIRGLSLPRGAAAVAAGAVGLAVISNLGDLRAGARFLRVQAPVARADLGALELARASVPRGYVAKHFPGTPFIAIRAARYFDAAESYGTPAFTPAELAAATEPARSTADAELVAIHRIALRRGSAATPGRGAPAVDAATGGTTGSRGGCVRFRPNAAEAAGVVPELRITIPAGGVALTAVGGPANVSIRRFAATFPDQPLARLVASGSGVLRVAPDRAPQPWHLRVAPEASVKACNIA
jgi:hypothetical protein